MMRKFIFLLLFTSVFGSLKASHISGGEIYYTYLGPSSVSPGKLSYKITLLLYKDTTVAQTATVAKLAAAYPISIYQGTGNLLTTINAVQVNYTDMNLTTYNPCLSTKPPVEFVVGTYEALIDLDSMSIGYFASFSQCCRVTGILNINSSAYTSGFVGATYWVKIPGSIDNIFAPNNSSPHFNRKDTILICKSSALNLDFSAVDPDSDSLSYSLCPGYNGGSYPNNLQPTISDPPPYTAISYLNGYSYLQPFGTATVSINPVTGIVTGTAPATTGIYLIAVLVEEYRKGVKIGEHRKDFQIKVSDCTISGAALKPSYITCNGFSMSFQNESTSSSIIGYLWDFGDVKNIPKDTSTQPAPTYNYIDTGTFVMKLKVTGLGGCQDSATALVRVYPGFVPGFSVSGSCYMNPYLFKDTTHTKYGVINSWFWNFGDVNVTNDTSSIQNPQYTYTTPGTRSIKLYVSNSKGCFDSVTTQIAIPDKPILNLPFRDTLICSNDTLPLLSSYSGGIISWSPNTRIINPNSGTPLVYPTDTTKYYVSVTNNGCINKDSIQVNVLQYITVNAGPDTSICKTDTFRLHPISYALSYLWTASSGAAISNIKYPLIQPLVTTKYYVTANLGKCQAQDSVNVKVAPYPAVAVGPDTTICFGSRAQLYSNITGANFSWSPSNSLINANTLNPIAGPVKTTNYIIRVTDTLGCNKPVSDTIIVTVIPLISVNAGRDTSIVANQPLQLFASTNDSSGATFSWSPTIGLNNPFISSPVTTLGTAIDSVRYIVTVSKGYCYGQDDIIVRVFKNTPEIYVPSAFTPNNDGKNDIIKPITVGIVKLDFFRIFNRWGQLLFSSSEMGKGWDGIFNGTKQSSGTYVYMAQGTDYLGNSIFRKGTVVLIR